MIVTDTSLLVPLLKARCVGVVAAFGALRVSREVEKEVLRVAPTVSKAWADAKSHGQIEVQHVPPAVRQAARALDGKHRLGIVDCIGIAWAKHIGEELAIEDRDALEAAEGEGVETITIAAALLAHMEAGKLSAKEVARLAIAIELDGDHTWGARDRAALGV